MAKTRRATRQRSLSQARATRRPAPAVVASPPAKRGRLSPATTRWLRTSKIPIILAAVILVAILVAMYFRLIDPAAGAVSLPAPGSLRLPDLSALLPPAATALGQPLSG